MNECEILSEDNFFWEDELFANHVLLWLVGKAFVRD